MNCLFVDLDALKNCQSNSVHFVNAAIMYSCNVSITVIALRCSFAAMCSPNEQW